ncbi:hypothetical protein GA0116948_10538 [Chitinophaga costaii]|uniref:Uncharacterized protein n=1 Tax=Chitinophaga costaii TaxID=1335309 RepID=A0A1C4D2V2_9BACT|nr:hypothetical protein [Chitinophaga costaii]PUZ24434.1 hypothetical protein DCM91_10975 [Chitinophaga costaii]SCC25580.1 hypothetical protein GA0116948_10538 [Chitinophaga costaii]
MENTVENKKDFTRNWVASSRFLFYVSLFCLVFFVLAGCYNLYVHHYQGKPAVNVPDNTLYDPKYK